MIRPFDEMAERIECILLVHLQSFFSVGSELVWVAVVAYKELSAKYRGNSALVQPAPRMGALSGTTFNASS